MRIDICKWNEITRNSDHYIVWTDTARIIIKELGMPIRQKDEWTFFYSNRRKFGNRARELESIQLSISFNKATGNISIVPRLKNGVNFTDFEWFVNQVYEFCTILLKYNLLIY